MSGHDTPSVRHKDDEAEEQLIHMAIRGKSIEQLVEARHLFSST